MNREEFFEVLKEVQDPGLQQSLVQLNLIKDVMIREDRVNASIVLSALDDESKAIVQAQIEEALQKAGVSQVHLRFREMTDFERNELRNNSESDTHKGKDPMQQRRQAEMKAAGTPPLLQDDCKTVIIAVASGKGGVGKSTVTVNLAAAMARQGKKVGIMDADIYGFSVPDMMGIEEEPQLVDGQIRPAERYGVKVISMGFFVQDNAPVIWRGPMLGKMLKNFFGEVNWGELDYLLLDLPPGTGDVALDVHQMIPRSKEILVTTPHATAAFVAARAGAMAVQTNHEILGVVENMAYFVCDSCGNREYVFGRGGGAKLAEEMHAELLGQIPLGAPDNHPQEPEYSPSVYKATHETGKLYDELAKRVMAKTSEA